MLLGLGLTLTPAAGARTQAGGVVITSATHQARHALVTWTLAPGWVPSVIAVSSSAAVASDGSFFQENIKDGGIPDSGQTRWLSASQLDYGTYYIRIQSHAEDFSAVEWSDTATLVIEPLLPTVKMRVFDVDGDILLSRVQIGNPVTIKTWWGGPIFATSEFSLKGQVCVVTKRAPRCSHVTPNRWNLYWTHATVSPANVVKRRFSAFARLNGQVLQRISVPVKSR